MGTPVCQCQKLALKNSTKRAFIKTRLVGKEKTVKLRDRAYCLGFQKPTTGLGERNKDPGDWPHMESSRGQANQPSYPINSYLWSQDFQGPQWSPPPASLSDEETEAQKGRVTCQRATKKLVASVGPQWLSVPGMALFLPKPPSHPPLNPSVLIQLTEQRDHSLIPPF